MAETTLVTQNGIAALVAALAHATITLNTNAKFIVSVPSTSIVVRGAGVTALNGTYLATDTFNAKQRYNLTGHSAGSNYAIQYGNGGWSITDSTGTTIIIGPDVGTAPATPDLVTAWYAVNSVTVSGAGTSGANGTYTYSTMFSGFASYLFGSFSLINGTPNASVWNINAPSGRSTINYYKSNSNTSNPGAGTWTAISGSNPVPSFVVNDLYGAAPTVTKAPDDIQYVTWSDIVTMAP